MNAFLVIGFIGVLVLVVGFVMNQVAIWKPSDFEYDFINLIGGLLLVFSCYLEFAVRYTVCSMECILPEGLYYRCGRIAETESEKEIISKWGCSSAGQSASFAPRRSRVRLPSAPPLNCEVGDPQRSQNELKRAL